MNSPTHSADEAHFYTVVVSGGIQWSNSLNRWTAANQRVSTLVVASYYAGNFAGVAVDGAGNLFFTDSQDSTIKKWTATNNTVTTLVSSGLNVPSGLAADGAGNVYIADTYNNAIKEWTAANNTVTTLVAAGLNWPCGVAVDVAGNIYIADTYYDAVRELPHAFVDPTAKWESPAAGSDVLPVVLPATANLLPPFAPTSDQAWLTITGITNGVVSFAFAANTDGTNRTAHITLLGQAIAITQFGSSCSLGTSVLLEGPGGGSDSVILAAPIGTDAWTATANDAWLHLSVANQSGTGSTNLVFSYDANPAATRTGTLTIAGQTLTVTQAGSTYVAAPGCSLVSSGLIYPVALAVDGSGNLFIADMGNDAVKKWTAAGSTVTTLVGSDLSYPYGVALDGSGNVYVADTANSAIKEWRVADNTLTTLAASGLSSPLGVAVDSAGNVYFTDYDNNTVSKWTVTNNTVTPLITSGLNAPGGLAADGAGNLYIADTGDSAIKKWEAGNQTLITLIGTGLNQPWGVAVDVVGSVYVADSGNNAIKKWSVANGTVATLPSSGLDYPQGVAVDGAGTLYVADTGHNSIKAMPHAFVDSTAKTVGPAAGTDMLQGVLPATANLQGPFAPVSDQPWLSITGIANGVVTFAFDANPGSSSRTAHLTVLGQPVSITQPSIITQLPTNVTACAGGPAVFSVGAEGEGLTYQWQVSLNFGGSWSDIGGATNAIYTNLVTTLSDNLKEYQVVVNWGGIVVSSSPPAVLTVRALPTASVGPGQTICAGGSTAALGGSVGGTATGGLWTSSGTGTFAPDATTLNASYVSSTADAVAGSVTLTLTSTGQPAPCGPATAQMVATVIPAATAGTGGDQGICAGNFTLGLGGQVGGCATGGVWTTSGTGTYTPNTHTLNATYRPSSADVTAGSVTLTLTATGQIPACITSAQLVVTISAPVIVTQPTNANVSFGSPATFSVQATGTALRYQWQWGSPGYWVNVSATATNATYTTGPNSVGNNGTHYQVVVTQGSPCQLSVTSAVVVLTVTNTPTAPTNGLPFISTQPQSCRTQPGVAVSFTAYSSTATGYQWRFNGVDIPGATGMTLQIAHPQLTNSGYYIAIATNANGWAPSQKAYLAVVSDQGVVPFSNVGLAQVLSANYPQLFNGVAELVAGPEMDQMQPIPVNPWWPDFEPTTAAIANGYYDYGAVVSVPTVSPGQTVYYRVDVTDTTFNSTRPSRVLTLAAGGGAYPTPSVSAIQVPCYIEWPDPQPYAGAATNLVFNSGQTITLYSYYWCCGDFGYPHFQWRKDGVPIPGATNYTGGISYGAGSFYPFMTITNVQVADAANYDLVINGSYSFIDVSTSLSIRFTNSAVPVLITSQPADLTVCAGSPASFTVTTAGTNLGYQWQVSQDGGATFANISATATNAAYTNLDATPADSGNRYQVIVTGPGLSQTSSPPALLTVNAPATASAGANQTISAYSNTLPLGGNVGGCAAGGIWMTAGTGTFSPSATALNACYTPSAADLAVGTVTLTLTSIGPCAPCSAATAQVVVTIQWQPMSLGAATLLEGPSAGADSVVLAASAPTNTWTATANDGWLHLDAANQSGTGSTNVIFSYDANAGTNRNGTLTIAGQTLTVTQAGSTYVAASSAATTLASSGLGNPWYVDVDGTGSVYIADGANDAIKRWTPMNNSVNTVVTLATNSVAVGVAVDGAGNVYMSDQGDNTLKVWSAANHAWSTLVSSGLSTPYAIAVDWIGNVYFADTGNNAIKAWTVANNSVTTLAGTASMPYGVGVDRAGNVYFPDGNSIKKWTAANNSVATLASRSGYYFYGVAVDGAGNVHYSATAPPGLKVIGKWKAASNTFTTLVSSGLQVPRGVAVDGADNVYFTDVGYGTIKELPHVFLDPTAKTEGPAAGSDVLLPVLPATANLLTPFAPTSDQSWLTITGVTNGVVSFSFTANTGSTNRTANITLLGQSIPVTQTALTPPTLIGPPLLSNGTFQFAFSNSDLGATFTVLTTTNLSLPLSNWTVVGLATNTAPGLFQFSTGTTNYPQGFYRVRSP